MELMTKTWPARRCPRAWERRSSCVGRHHVARARRVSRKAEKAAQQARLALARAI